MSKYWLLFKITLQEYFVYRLNFVLWRFRSLVFTLSLLFFWLAVFGQKASLLGYQRSQMITYLLGVALLDGIILSSRTADLAGQIRSGELSKYLLKPVGVFKFFMTRDFVDKTLNIGFAVIEIAAIIYFLNFSVYFPKELVTILIFFLHLLISFFLFYFFSSLLSIFAFWTDDIWATRWLFGTVLLDFFSGVIFPIDILPSGLVKIINLTPFPYMIFSPLKIWLGQLSTGQMIRSVVISSFWLFCFFFLSQFFWKKGLKKYGAFGG